jgi:hypothetical protein
MRRIVTDLTMCFKILNGYVDINCENVFEMSDVTQTRGHSMKLAKGRVGLCNNRDS